MRSGGNNFNYFPENKLTKLANLVQFEHMLMFCWKMEGGFPGPPCLCHWPRPWFFLLDFKDSPWGRHSCFKTVKATCVVCCLHLIYCEHLHHFITDQKESICTRDILEVFISYRIIMVYVDVTLQYFWKLVILFFYCMICIRRKLLYDLDLRFCCVTN